MLPDAKDCPSLPLKRGGLASIAVLVGLQLGSPEVVVALWHRAVLGAGMPEAAINEYGKPSSGEDDVGSDVLVLKSNAEVLAESQSAAM